MTTAIFTESYVHPVYNTEIEIPAGSLCHVLPCDGGEVYALRLFADYEILEEWDNAIYIMPEDVEDEGFVAPAISIVEQDHDCNEHVVHSHFYSDRGFMQDAYNCGICGALLQVG